MAPTRQRELHAYVIVMQMGNLSALNDGDDGVGVKCLEDRVDLARKVGHGFATVASYVRW